MKKKFKQFINKEEDKAGVKGVLKELINPPSAMFGNPGESKSKMIDDLLNRGKRLTWYKPPVKYKTVKVVNYKIVKVNPKDFIGLPTIKGE